MDELIYLDHAATTPVFPEVLDAMLPWLRPDHVGNASSIHSQGAAAFRAIEEARRRVADLINADSSEIFFTSGGTESNNTWINCLTARPVITTMLEHHSVLDAISHARGTSVFGVFRPHYISTDSGGQISVDDVERALKQHDWSNCAVSLMWVNNELGTINPIEKVGELCRRNNVPFHTDAVAAVGHVPIDVKAANVDFLSMSGHKFGAPTGIGALYIRSGVFHVPLIWGGGQEQGMRAGTYNVPGIVGMGKAAEIVKQNLGAWRKKWGSLRGLFRHELAEKMSVPYQINGKGGTIADNIISLTIPGVNGESLLLLLDNKGICLSAGSACSAASSNPSHVLKGIGFSDEFASSTVRISMGCDTRAEDMMDTASAIAECAKRLKSLYP